MNKLFTSLVLACFMLLGMRTSAQISQPLSNGYIRTNLNPVRFLVNTPSGLAGLKRASLATWGGQAVPSIMNAPVVRGLDSLAALPLTNGSAISGKVCLLFRGGSITFAQKAQYAYQAGAIAVIIVNNVDGEPIVMGNTGTATYTTMPIVMIKNTDGIALNNALISSTPVAVSIGSWSLATHDLGLLPAFQSAPHALSIPYSQLSAGAGRLPYRNFVGGAVGNFGTSAETGISVTDSVTWTPTSGSSSIVHTGSYTVPNMAANDSVRFGFGDATSPWSLNVPASTGNYTYKYDLKFSNTDAIPQDNTLSFTQYVTDSIFCKGSYDYKLMQPLVSQGIQPSGITNAFSMGPLFYMAKGKYAARKIQYSVSKNTVPTLDQEEAVALLYKWVDGLNGQPLDSFVEGDELRLVGINRKTFTTADSVGKVFTVPVFDPSSVTKTVSLDSNAWYWVSVQASNNCFIGVDYSASFFTRSYIQSKLLNNLEMPELLWSDDYANLGGSGTALAPFPFGGNAYDIDSTFFDRFYSIPALAFHISKNQIGAVLPGVGIPSEEITIGSMVIAPVPANDVVQVSLSLSKSSNVAVRLLDVTGKIVSRLDVLSMKDGSVKLDCSNVASGNYYMAVFTDDGHLVQKVSVRH